MKHNLKVFIRATQTRKKKINTTYVYFDLESEFGEVNTIGPSRPYHLHFVSDREIKKGDFVIWMDEIKKVKEVQAEIFYLELIGERYQVAQKCQCDKIEATTDKSLNILLIPQSFIDCFVEKRGQIKYVYLELYRDLADTIVKYPNNEVMICPSKYIWGVDEMAAVLEKYLSYNKTAAGVSLPFEDWFEENYYKILA